MTVSRRVERIAWIALLAAAAAVRLIDLGDRPYHHDESQDAYFSWLFLKDGTYEYDPLLHGPLRFYLLALLQLVFGDSDFTARLLPAIMGFGMVALCLALRPLVGRGAAFATAALLAFGPAYLYFSRFTREDITIACVTLALVVVVFRFLAAPRPWQPALIGALLAASFAIKESTFITVFVAGTFFMVWLVLDWRRGPHAGGLWRSVKSVGGAAWLWGVTAFAFVYLTLFTTFFTDPQHWDGLWEGLDYWLGQHEVGRGGEAWHFYLVLLVAEEWPTLLLGGIGAVAVARRPTPIGCFALWSFIVSLIVYSWAGEKFAWLLLHPLLGLVILAGLGVQAIFTARRPVWRAAGIAVATVGAVYLVWASVNVNALHRADPRELLVSTQSAEEVRGVRDEVMRAVETAQRRTGAEPAVTIDTAEGATFPYAWYFRDLDGIGYLDFTNQQAPPDAGILVLTDANYQRLKPALGDYEARRFPFRVWWVRDYADFSPRAFWRYLVAREPWSEPGGMDEWLLVRRDLLAA
jgi:uncharacterized protein (TIGR03663 family)